MLATTTRSWSDTAAKAGGDPELWEIQNGTFFPGMKGQRRSEAEVPPGSGGTPLRLTMGTQAQLEATRTPPMTALRVRFTQTDKR